MALQNQDYANTVSTAPQQVDASIQGSESEKRALSQSSTPQRNSALRGGIKQRLYTSPFVDRESLDVDSDMPTIESFPFKLSASNAEGSHSQTASAQASLPPPVESLKAVESMAGMEIMMRRLLKEQDDRNED